MAYLTPRHLTIQHSDTNMLTYLICNLLMFYFVVIIPTYLPFFIPIKKMLSTHVVQTNKILK